MIKSIKIWEEFENEFLVKSKLKPSENIKLYEEMRKLAISTGIFPPKDLLFGIDSKIKLAKFLNK